MAPSPKKNSANHHKSIVCSVLYFPIKHLKKKKSGSTKKSTKKNNAKKGYAKHREKKKRGIFFF